MKRALPMVRIKPKRASPAGLAPSKPTTSITPTECRSLSANSSSSPTSGVPSWDGSESVLTTAMRRAAMRRAIVESDRAPSPLPVAPKPKPTRRPEFPPPESYRWPTRTSMRPPQLNVADHPLDSIESEPDLRRWYHGVAFFLFWHFAIIAVCSYLLLRVFWKPIAPLLIGTWMSSILYSAELAQAVFYYQNFKNDSGCLKALVWTTFFIDTVGLLNDYACVYLYTIKHAGDVAYFANQNATIPVYVFTTVAVALPVQIFLVVRYWRFTHKKITVLVLAILILVAFGGSFTCGLMVALFPAFKDRHKSLCLVTGAPADLGIAAALLWEFLQAKPGTSPKMRNVINRLVAVTVQTGAATATIAVAALIGFPSSSR
ncbi:hypothetical protein FB45DRAFT_1102830 [Roridomyces roridus]|uniref:Uncharacterized protein n=1 Tax=Roridomyces roridus TaxID=1738132 RepID=A0AAD7CGM6_9AGAR|nr:hypothetical protein FB45DRAFT_1102830 [Roridomyces roridus]